MKILYRPNEYSQQRQQEKKRWIYPVLMAMEAEYQRKRGHDVFWDLNFIHPGCETYFDKIVDHPEGLPFLDLPAPDREFSMAKARKYQRNGNFKLLPGTYIQVANGCWHGKCSFCVEKGRPYEVRTLSSVIDEIEQIWREGYSEIFDDSGTFPVGEWLEDFCRYFRGNKKPIGCNMRMVDAPYEDMKKAGFRMVLFGMESANQKTLDFINKGVKVEDIKYIVKASHAGLDPHVAVMFGYPFETDQDATETLRTIWWLLKKGYAKTAQASFYTPQDKNSNPSHRKYVKQIYWAARYPRFWYHKIRKLKDIDDVKYLLRMIKEGASSCLNMWG